MSWIKGFKTYDEQLDLLVQRGMHVDDHSAAAASLRRVNYYRLSGYWYPFRRFDDAGSRVDEFCEEARLSDVIALYEFDTRLRTATFDALVPVELSLRATLGYALGKIDPCAHLRPEVLSSRASGENYDRWIREYRSRVRLSREDFVTHHRSKYDGILPVWAAVEVLDWGSLAFLFDFAPDTAQLEVADTYGLTAPQLRSWMKSLNIIRNVCAHHGRLFNRTHTLTPKMPATGRFPELDQAGRYMNRTLGQLTLIQHLRRSHDIPISRVLGAVIKSYPDVSRVPVSRIGTWPGWEESPLWQASSAGSRRPAS